MSERPDYELDGLLGDVRWAVDDDACRTRAAWDFAAVVARAHELDPERVSSEVVREVEAAAPVVSLAQERRARRVTRDDPEFERILADVRASVEHETVLRQHGLSAPIATTPQQVVPPSHTGRRVLWGVAALAAVLVLAIGLLQGVRYVQLQREAPADAALHLGDASQPEAEPATFDERERTSVRATKPKAVDPIAPEIVVPPEPPAPNVAAETPRREKPKKTSAPVVPAPSLSERLAALDAAAAVALRARDLPGAAAKFEQIVQQGGSSSLADLAFGELFHIAHRRGDTAGELALWKRYLARFPEGRFADDARAGVCRRATTAAKDACWRDYLDDFPKGSYVRQAEQHLDGKVP